MEMFSAEKVLFHSMLTEEMEDVRNMYKNQLKEMEGNGERYECQYSLYIIQMDMQIDGKSYT